MNKIKLAIIGGTGFYGLEGINFTDRSVKTPYGQVKIKTGEYKGIELAFLNRHGEGRNLPPHLINYRANIFALKKIGVRAILATNTVGAINTKMKPGSLVFIDQFIDFTKSRSGTFFDGEKGVVHIDLTNPYCEIIRQELIKAAKEKNMPFHEKGTLIVTEGPRFETPAEIKFFRSIGADLVGMTGFPEAALAREAGICYASICIATNFAAGASNELLNIEEIGAAMEKVKKPLYELILAVADRHVFSSDCQCKSSEKQFELLLNKK
ncbi:MAG: S-methyl-5'-thioadenosine phosphorylase [Patescibacteria group bacterium]|jgi:5'-methylthioadenosine phosphorylase